MSTTNVNQRDNTRNQSTLDITQQHIFMGNNKYQEVNEILNNTGGAVTLKSGMLVKRVPANPNQVAPYVTDDASNLLIGVLAMDGEVEVADAATLADVNYAIGGDVKEGRLVSSDGTAIDADALIGAEGLTLRHRLQELGFHLVAVTENTKLDN